MANEPTETPTFADMLAFAKRVLEAASSEMNLKGLSLGIAVYQRPNVAFVAVNESAQASAEFRAAIIDHLKRNRVAS